MSGAWGGVLCDAYWVPTGGRGGSQVTKSLNKKNKNKNADPPALVVPCASNTDAFTG